MAPGGQGSRGSLNPKNGTFKDVIAIKFTCKKYMILDIKKIQEHAIFSGAKLGMPNSSIKLVGVGWEATLIAYTLYKN